MVLNESKQQQLRDGCQKWEEFTETCKFKIPTKKSIRKVIVISQNILDLSIVKDLDMVYEVPRALMGCGHNA